LPLPTDFEFQLKVGLISSPKPTKVGTQNEEIFRRKQKWSKFMFPAMGMFRRRQCFGVFPSAAGSDADHCWSSFMVLK
jgi:hypothetical protein